MSATIGLPSGETATVTDGRWSAPVPILQRFLQAMVAGHLREAQLSSLYIPDQDAYLARAAARDMGGQLLSVTERQELEEGALE